MNTGDRSNYITTIYQYLITNNILHAFLYNRNIASNMYNDQPCRKEPINYALIWADTPEGQSFWKTHNMILSNRLAHIPDISLSLGELIDELTTLSEQIQPYEFW